MSKVDSRVKPLSVIARHCASSGVAIHRIHFLKIDSKICGGAVGAFANFKGSKKCKK